MTILTPLFLGSAVAAIDQSRVKIFPKKQVEWTLEVGFFLTFDIFVFDGATLGHVSGHVGTCHVDVQQMKKKGLGKLICLGTKIFKIRSKLRELWP